MKLEELPLNKEIIDVLKEHEISELYPPQAEALPYVLKGENMVLSIPTASGKSLVAYLTIVNRLIHEEGKALYVVPLKALAREKYEELKLFERLGLKVGISTSILMILILGLHGLISLFVLLKKQILYYVIKLLGLIRLRSL